MNIGFVKISIMNWIKGTINVLKSSLKTNPIGKIGKEYALSHLNGYTQKRLKKWSGLCSIQTID